MVSSWTNVILTLFILRLGELLVTLSDSKVAPNASMQAHSPRMTPADSLSEGDLAQDSGNSTFCKVYYEEPSSEQDILNLARSLFDLKEYRKCAHLLNPIITNATANRDDSNSSIRSSALIQNSLFLKNYALFLVSEQVKEEEILETGGSTDKIICSPVIN